MTSISRPGGTSVYIKEDGGDIFWSSDDVSYVNKITFPVSVQNTNTSAGVLTVIFKSDLTLSNVNQYFECTTSNIQFGSNTLNANGSRPIITIQVASYPGLIKNYDGSSSFNNITIKNIVVIGTGYSLATGAGWIGQESFASGATNNQIINCSSEGNIITNGGGIVGTSACSTANSDLTITNCTSKGTIANLGGGIIGGACSTDTNCTITISNCSSNGLILSGSGTNGGGGICGANCAANNGIINVDNSYSIGVISTNAGGIFGSKCGTNSGVTNATNCYSTGQILGGGIYGKEAGTGTNGTTTATNCFSTGLIVGGGIYAAGYSASATANHCYTSGANGGVSAGGIWAGQPTNDNLPSQGANNYSEMNHSGSGWTDSYAIQALLGAPSGSLIGNTWAQLNGPDTAYILAVSGYSPYTTTLGTTTSSSIAVGGTTAPAVVPGYTFSLLEINNSPASSFPSFSINASTGEITADSSTPLAVYTISIYASINPYSITTYTLTVSAAPVTADSGATAEGVSCCAVPMNIGTDVDYETRNNFATGNTMIGGVRGRQPYASYTMLLYKQMAFAAKR